MAPWMLKEFGAGEIEGFPYTAKGVTRGANFARRLGSIVLNPQSYTGTHKACALHPTVAFRVWNQKQWAVVLICFGCNQLVILEHPSQAPLNWYGGIRGIFA